MSVSSTNIPAHLILFQSMQDRLLLGPKDATWHTPDCIIQILSEPAEFSLQEAAQALDLSRDAVVYSSTLLQR